MYLRVDTSSYILVKSSLIDAFRFGAHLPKKRAFVVFLHFFFLILIFFVYTITKILQRSTCIIIKKKNNAMIFFLPNLICSNEKIFALILFNLYLKRKKGMKNNINSIIIYNLFHKTFSATSFISMDLKFNTIFTNHLKVFRRI